ncbi:glucose transporter type 1-like [Ostrea edulis]|uniref:glucose transporter type 1-like n=1 Tax=Ostrea edulis TaxID=37623 RepID=UPI0024AF94B8|nr:glucose transporter type 1-like [Ostrea edulis]XP_048750700.2 glucose transporter type 1-like [Ostrea edulis]XP_048750701.2 glucose transporter type 1-like [Ostrea edulis]XP_048750702.2 glucose transporter type 1-like [Ostrea edulis]XP_048750703.2 glucose transporter type 1-like [Ostrea edulis]
MPGLHSESRDQLTPEPIEPLRGRITAYLSMAVFSAIMGSLQYGYNTGVINAPEKKIKEFMNASHAYRFNTPMDGDTQLNLYSLLVAIFAVGGMLGGLMAGWWADFFGRKFGMLLNNAFAFAAGGLFLFSREVHSYEMVIVARFLIGFNCGLYTGLTPLYLTEIATADIRGALGTLHQFGVTIGIFLSQILGFPEILGNGEYWHVLLGLCVAPAAIQLLTMPFCPESPRYLLLTKEKEVDALNALVKLRGTPGVDGDMNEMRQEHQAMQSEKKIGILHLLKKRSLRMPLIISVVMQLSQQLSGINAIFYYSFKLFTSAGISDEMAAHATSGIGAIMVTMTLITIPLMDRIGRRSLHLTGLGGMFFFSILITITLSLTDKVTWFDKANVAVSLLYVVFFAIGPGSIPWMIVAELFTQGPRVSAMSIAVLVNWVFNFAVGYFFPIMQKGLGNYSFLPFTVLLLLFWIFVYIYLPETKNRTFEDIASSWKKSQNDTGNPQAKYTPKEDTAIVQFQQEQTNNR